MTYKHNPDGAAEADPSSVILIGPTGVGKTAVGSALARLLGCPFIDSDHVMSLRHGPVSNLYAVHGEAAFRRTEAETIASLVGSEPRPFILSLGGGAVTDPGTCELLRGLMVVWLDTDLKSVLPRLQAQADRPLFAGDLAGRWQRNADARNGLYAQVATLKVDARVGNAEELAEDIRGLLATPGSQLQVPSFTRPAEGLFDTFCHRSPDDGNLPAKGHGMHGAHTKKVHNTPEEGP